MKTIQNLSRGRASVVCLLLSALPDPFAAQSQAALTITRQPTNQVVSLGANVTFRVTASGDAPMSFQWRREEVPIVWATNSTLTLTNVVLNDRGHYSVVVANAADSAKSEAALLEVDSTFTKITVGPVVNDRAESLGFSWGDYDNDGFLDLYVAHAGPIPSALYHNQGDGSFTRITNGALASVVSNGQAAVWGDYDNDGKLDLFLANYAQGGNRLFHNEGDGQFSVVPKSTVAKPGSSVDAAWADYDRDGFIDLFVSNNGDRENDFLFRNNGDGTFRNMTEPDVGPIVADRAYSWMCSWGDYDSDGYPDLWVCDGFLGGLLYHNLGDGTFSKVDDQPLSGLRSSMALWGDYDNDGMAELFLEEGLRGPSSSCLFDYLGNQAFSDVAAVAGFDEPLLSGAASWGDYDNDGHLDLFVLNSIAATAVQPNRLYRNNGDGHFASVDVGSPIRDGIERINAGWVDYNNDGFLDLYVVCGGPSPQRDLLYRGNGNSNGWLKVKLEGAASNRSGIGGKVRVKATIGGKTYWQMREISGNSGLAGGQGLVAHFGLGDASTVDLVRIEWPSGVVQELEHVTGKQMLTVVEPVRISINRAGTVHIPSWKGQVFDVQSASNPAGPWTTQTTVTNTTGTLDYIEAVSPQSPPRFYRVQSR